MTAFIEKTCAIIVSVLLLAFPVYFAMILSSTAYAQDVDAPGNASKVIKEVKPSASQAANSKVSDPPTPPTPPEPPSIDKDSSFIKIDKDGIRIQGRNKKSISSHKDEKLEDIVVPTVLFLMILGIVVGIYYYDHKNKKAYFETVKHIVDQGQPVPASLLEGSFGKKKKTWLDDLKSGLMLCGVGAGLTVFFLTTSGGAWGIGAIILCIGIAKVISGYVRKKYEGQA